MSVTPSGNEFFLTLAGVAVTLLAIGAIVIEVDKSSPRWHHHAHRVKWAQGRLHSRGAWLLIFALVVPFPVTYATRFVDGYAYHFQGEVPMWLYLLMRQAEPMTWSIGMLVLLWAAFREVTIVASAGFRQRPFKKAFFSMGWAIAFVGYTFVAGFLLARFWGAVLANEWAITQERVDPLFTLYVIGVTGWAAGTLVGSKSLLTAMGEASTPAPDSGNPAASHSSRRA